MNIDFKEIRESRGLKQKWVAEKTGLTPSTIHRYEQGLIEPSYSNVVKIMNVLGYEVIIKDKKSGDKFE